MPFASESFQCLISLEFRCSASYFLLKYKDILALQNRERSGYGTNIGEDNECQVAIERLLTPGLARGSMVKSVAGDP